MGEYLKIMIAVPIVTALIGMIMPEGKLKSPTRLIISLVALLAVLLPMRSLAETVKDGLDFDIETDTEIAADGGDFSGEQLIVDETCRLISRQLEGRIAELYGLENAKIRLSCDTSDYENVIIESAILCAVRSDSAEYAIKCSEAARYVAETLGCRCDIEFTD